MKWFLWSEMVLAGRGWFLRVEDGSCGVKWFPLGKLVPVE